jgi:hypothetical protein
MGSAEIPTKDIFDTFVEFDNAFKTGINNQMCSDFCICPGKATDSWYKAYKAVDAKVWKESERVWTDSAL